MIQRIVLCNAANWWNEEIEKSTEKILADYEITREQIISIVHDGNDGKVYLYWMI